MNFCLRCVALISAAVLFSASTASAETYNMYTFSSGIGTITAYGTIITTLGTNLVVTPVGETTMTPVTVLMPIPGFPFYSIPVYAGHVGAMTTSQPATAFDGTYRDAMNQIHTISVTGTLIP